MVIEVDVEGIKRSPTGGFIIKMVGKFDEKFKKKLVLEYESILPPTFQVGDKARVTIDTRK